MFVKPALRSHPDRPFLPHGEQWIDRLSGVGQLSSYNLRRPYPKQSVLRESLPIRTMGGGAHCSADLASYIPFNGGLRNS
jgi:hypothetical protein